jgi:predicted Zn finger-like uncharacterized protein
MHVTCPSCRTTYRVPAPYRRRRRAPFECTACGHVFEPALSDPDWDDDEPFVMDDEDARSRGAADDDADEDDDAAEPVTADDPEEDEDDEEEDDEVTEDEAPRAPRGAGRHPPRRAARPARSSPARFAVRSLLAVVLFYGVVGVYVTTFPESSRAAMQRIPLVGPSLARTPLGLGQIELGDVTATFQPLADSGDEGSALVVVATVTNHAAVTADQIVLAIDLEGEPPRTERRVCTGTRLNVSPFKRGELELMASYNGSRVARIAPGASVACQSIFLDYPRDLHSVRIRVASAQGR